MRNPRALAPFAVLAFAACADSASHEVQHDELARVAAKALAPGDGGGLVSAYADAALLALGGMPPGMERYEDTMVVGRRGGAELSYMVFCRDVTNATMTCGSTTDHADILASYRSHVEADGVHARVVHHAMWALDNLQGKNAMLVGESTLEIEATVDDIEYLVTATPDTVVLLGAEGWMRALAGETTAVLEGTRDGVALDAVVDVVYDDDWRSAALAVDEDGYRLDLQTGELR